MFPSGKWTPAGGHRGPASVHSGEAADAVAFPHRFYRIDSTVRFGEARGMRPDALFTVVGWARWVARDVPLWRGWAKTMRWPALLGERIGSITAWWTGGHHRYGKKAKLVVEKALRVTKLLPKAVRSMHTHAIFGVLNERRRLQIGENPMPQDTSQYSKHSSLAGRLHSVLRAHASVALPFASFPL